MATETSQKPRLFLISLNKQPFFDEMYDRLITRILAKASIQRAITPGPAMRVLSEEPRPAAVLITDEALTTLQHSQVWVAVLAYVREGGTAVVMGHFSSFVKPNNIKPFFAKAGLPWESGDYHRTTLVLNTCAIGQGLAAQLPAKYSPRAVFLKNVDSTAQWYRTDENSARESLVFSAGSVNNPNETPVAHAKVGEGQLGYVGDINAEEDSDTVVLALCGLLG